MFKNLIKFEDSAKKEILLTLGYTVDKKGFLIDNSGERVRSNTGKVVHEADFAGIRKDSKTKKYIIYTSDLSSLIKLTDKEIG